MIEHPVTGDEWGTPAEIADELSEQGVTARMVYDWIRDGLLCSDGPDADAVRDGRRWLVRFDAAAEVEHRNRGRGRPRARVSA